MNLVYRVTGYAEDIVAIHNWRNNYKTNNIAPISLNIEASEFSGQQINRDELISDQYLFDIGLYFPEYLTIPIYFMETEELICYLSGWIKFYQDGLYLNFNFVADPIK
jgi:hypothetical protein